jgi:hypothetical protein
MSGVCETYGGDEKYVLSVQRKLEKIRWLRKHGGTWEANIKMNLKVIGWEGVDGTGLYQHRYKRRAVAKALMKFQVS